ALLVAARVVPGVAEDPRAMDSAARARRRQRGGDDDPAAQHPARAHLGLSGLLPCAADAPEEEGAPDQHREHALVAVAPLLQSDAVQLPGGVLERQPAEFRRRAD